MTMESNETFAESANVENGGLEWDAAGTLGSRLACILSYGGSLSDILINYTLVVINVLYCHVALRTSLDKYNRGPCAVELTRQRNRMAFARLALMFVVMFQVVLCLAVGCSGVSIIWCAMCGWSIYDRLRRVDGFQGHEMFVHRMGQIVIVLDILAIGYYGITSPMITTIAHSLALILGAILAFISTRVATDVQ
jgi:cell division protein ZapA (FtsZ GTPase activity inhibitor)